MAIPNSTEFNEWVAYGVEKGWASFPVCDTHEGLPMTLEEEDEWADGYDPCSPAMRIWTENIK